MKWELTLIIKKQNNKSSLILLKYLIVTNFNIKKLKNASILLLMSNYFIKFKYAYWINLIKLYIEYIELSLIRFMKLYNNLNQLTRSNSCKNEIEKC